MKKIEISGLSYKTFLFSPSSAGIGEVMRKTKKGLKDLVDKSKEEWESIEDGVYKTTGSYKLFRSSLVLNIDKKNNSCYVDVAPRRPCNKKDASGNRPESAHHTYVYFEGYPQSMKCTCEGFFYPNKQNPTLTATCPHIFVNMSEFGFPVFDFEQHPEVIVDILKLHHKHRIPYHEIDVYLLEKYSKEIIAKPYQEGLKAGVIKIEHSYIKNPKNLEKILKKY